MALLASRSAEGIICQEEGEGEKKNISSLSGIMYFCFKDICTKGALTSSNSYYSSFHVLLYH